MNLDLSTFLTIIGTIATLVFGFLSIDLFKRKKNPGKLIIVKQTAIGLFNNIAKNFDEISIQYKGAPIKENVLYIKAGILNDGDIDIDGKSVEKTLNLSLKDNLKWIKAKVTHSSPELKCKTEIGEEDKSLKFDFGLIRRNEFFQFEALIETNDSSVQAEDIYDNIIISHRIPNTQKVITTSLLSEEQIVRKKKKMKSFGINIGAQFLGVVFLFFFQILYIRDAPILYKTIDGQEFKVTAKSDESIQLKNNITKEEKIISINEFKTPQKYIPFIPRQTFWQKITATGYIIPVLLIFIIIFIGSEYWELKKAKKYYKLFDIATE